MKSFHFSLGNSTAENHEIKFSDHSPAVEYIEAYFNPEAVTAKDIDEIDEEEDHE